VPGRPAVSRLKALPTCLFDPFRVGIALRIANRGHCPRLLQWLPFGQDSKARRKCHGPSLRGCVTVYAACWRRLPAGVSEPRP